ncbi:hypothetical protein V8E52_006877 [Russula decolorans]
MIPFRFWFTYFLSVSLTVLHCCSLLLVLALLCFAVFSVLLAVFSPSRCSLVAFVVTLALSVLTLKVLAKLFDCVDYFASLFFSRFFCSSSSSPFIFFFYMVLVHIVNIL